MPSIRKRLKKLTSSKKSKSTSDLDQIKRGESTDGIDQQDDTCSYISEAISEKTDASVVTNESSYSYASGEKKKKRRLKLKFSSKKKKEKLVKDPSGNVIFRSLSIEHDPRGTKIRNIDDSNDLGPDSVELSRSVGSNIGREECEKSEADGWRMSGLLESVDRASNHSLSSGKDNLISTFEDRRKALSKPEHESTPIKDSLEDKQAPQVEKDESENGKITVTSPINIIEVKFGTDKSKRTAETNEAVDGNEKDEEEENKHSGDEDSGSEELMAFKRDLEPVEEEDVIETINEDPECEAQLEDVDVEEEAAVPVIEENSIVCDVGKGKKVIIRHLQEVADNANLEMSGNVSMEDWLVLNIEKDDWVVVGYSKVGGEIAQLYEQSVDTV